MTTRTYHHPEFDNPDTDRIFGNQHLSTAVLLLLPVVVVVGFAVVTAWAMAVFG